MSKNNNSNKSNSPEPYVGMPIDLNFDDECQCIGPVGMAYVPMQQWPDETYDLGRSLKVGTIFPDLNLPLKGFAYKGGPR